MFRLDDTATGARARAGTGRSSKWRTAKFAAGLLTALTLASAGASAADGTAVTLSVTSEVPGAAAEVTCTITVDGEVREQAQSGALPIELTLEGGTVDCTITSDQPVRVVSKNSSGSRSQVVSSGGVIRVRLGSGS